MPDPHAPGHYHRPRLLIADDDPVVRSALSMALESSFDVVAAASDGEGAVAQAAATRPDGALVDVEMPGQAERARSGGSSRSPPKLRSWCSSSDESDDVVRHLVLAGAMAYLRKGLPPAELAKALKTAISAHRDSRTAG